MLIPLLGRERKQRESMNFIKGRSKSLRSRLLWMSSAIVMVFFTLVVLTEVYWFQNRFQMETESNREVARAIGLAFRQKVQDILNESFAIGAARQSFNITDSAAVQRYLSSLKDLYTAVLDFSIIDSSGTIINSSRPQIIGINVADRQYFRRLKTGDTAVVSDFIRTKDESTPGFIVGRGFYEKDGFSFAVTAFVQPEMLGGILTLHRQRGEYITLFDRQGNLIYTDQHLDTLTIAGEIWKESDPNLRKALKGEEAGGYFTAPVDSGRRRLGALVPIEDIGWVAGSSKLVADFFQPFILPYALILFISIAVAVLTLVLARRTVDAVTRSLSMVQKHMRDVARGDFTTVRTASGLSEFDALIADTNTMAVQLKDREQRMKLFASVVENSGDFIGLASPELEPFYVNDAGKNIIGLESDEEVSRSKLIEYFHPQDRPIFQNEAIPALQKHQRWRREIRFRNIKTGESIPTLCNVFAVKDDDGKLLAWATISPGLTELRQAAAALERSEERFRGAIEGLLDAFLIMTPVSDRTGAFVDYHFEYANRVALRFMDITWEEFVGKKLTDIFTPQSLGDLPGIYEEVFRTGEPAALDAYHIKTPVGVFEQGIYIDIRTTRTGNALTVAWRDVTAQVEAESRLRESEANFRTLAQNSPEVIARLDRQLRHIFVNAYGEKVYGISAEQVVGKTNEELGMPSDKVAFWKENFEIVLKTGEIKTVEFDFESPNFGHQYLSSLFVPEYNDRQQIVSILAITRDITDLKTTELALRRSEERFRELADSMPQLVWTADPDGTVDYYNKKYREFGGISPGDDGVWKWGPVVHEDDLQPTIDAWSSSVKTGDTYQIEHRVRHRDGSFHWYLSRAYPARDESGRLVKWYGTATNIDISKQAQADLEESQSRLKLLNQNLEDIVVKRTEQVRALSKALTLAEQRERKRFSYILHENLQQQLLGAKMLLGQHLREHKAAERMEEIEEVAHGLAMLESALETTKTLSVEMNPPILRRQGLDAALEWLANHMDKKYGLKVDLRLEKSLGAIRDETQQMLTQMVRELLNNVRQHAGVNRAAVTAGCKQSSLRLTVSDEGRGFIVGDVLRETAGKTQLGLFSIRERLRLFNGDLIINSTVGEGTECILILPVIKCLNEKG